MKQYTIKVRQNYSRVHTCICTVRFIEIQPEIDIGYERKCCPWCVPYKHSGKSPPPITHEFVPQVFMQNIVILNKVVREEGSEYFY